MSIKLMSAIFATKFRDLKDAAGHVTKGSTAKFILMALADHANDDGQGAYPGLIKMELKTALSHQTILSAYKTLKQSRIITYAGKSKFRTNRYILNTQCFPGNGDPLILPNRASVSLKPHEYQDASNLSEECKPLECQAASRLSEECKSLELNHPLTTLKPLIDNDDETKIAAKLKNLSHLYETTIGAMTPLMADLLRNAAIDYPAEWFEPAFEIAVKNNVRRWIYVETILDGWKRNGFGWKPESAASTREQRLFTRSFKPRRGQNGEDRPRYQIPDYSQAELATIDEINRMSDL